ncbi:hypothetical protein EDC62_0023 [Tibeticola sediminis]|uniref:Response regulatory domain-containing protein n=2 Tax=Tibeticola sediminis TaxID=1917811 RepID=A0A3N4UUC8_9BURK|nr:hypothetical protein EDC62_0023 [Tibeticola sediminis]
MTLDKPWPMRIMSRMDPTRLALVGLAPIDRLPLIALMHHNRAFALAPSLAEADLIVVNGDDPATLHSVERELHALQSVLLIGGTPHGRWPVLRRPLTIESLEAVLKEFGPADAQAELRTEETRAITLWDELPEPPSAGHADSGSQRAFLATQPFAPLSHSGEPATDTRAPESGFPATRPFSPSEVDAIEPNPSAPAASVSADRIDEASLLLWREAQAAPAGTPARAGPIRLTLPELAQTATADTAPEPATAEPTRRRIVFGGAARLAQSALAKSLERAGYAVCVAGDGVALQHQIDQGGPEALLLDEAFFGSRVFGLCRQLRRGSSRATMPLLVFSDRRAPLRAWLARAMGCDAWLALPGDLPQLKRWLKAAAAAR